MEAGLASLGWDAKQEDSAQWGVGDPGKRFLLHDFSKSCNPLLLLNDQRILKMLQPNSTFCVFRAWDHLSCYSASLCQRISSEQSQRAGCHRGMTGSFFFSNFPTFAERNSAPSSSPVWKRKESGADLKENDTWAEHHITGMVGCFIEGVPPNSPRISWFNVTNVWCGWCARFESCEAKQVFLLSSHRSVLISRIWMLESYTCTNTFQSGCQLNPKKWWIDTL